MRSLMRKLACLALLLGMMPALHAQLDNTHFKTTTDLLDMYTPRGSKPEFVSVFDFSYSMHALMWDTRYYTAGGQDHLGASTTASTTPLLTNSTWHFGTWNSLPNDDWPGIVPVIDYYGKVKLLQGDGGHKAVSDAGTPAYPINTIGAVDAHLVQPDGTEMNFSGTKLTWDNDYPNTGGGTLTDYVKKASHVRITVTATNLKLKNSSGVTTTYAGPISRTIDLPIPWAVFKRDNSPAVLAKDILYTIADPKGGPVLDADRMYLSKVRVNGTNNNIVNNAPDDPAYTTSPGGGKIGRFHYTADFFWWIFFGTDQRNADNSGSTNTGHFIIPAVSSSGVPAGFEHPDTGTANAKTWKNGLSGMTRLQALRVAVLTGWFANQDNILWAIRYLDKTNEDSSPNTNTSSVNGAPGTLTNAPVTRQLRLLAKASGPAITQANQDLVDFLQGEPAGGTPLEHALANTYAQLAIANEAQSIFNPATTGTFSPPACRKTFVALFTDGASDGNPNPGGDDFPGTKTSESLFNSYFSTRTGFLANSSFNIWTLSAVASHYPSSIATVLSGNAPFKIVNRGATSTNPRRIRTMTVGMSLPGTYASGALKALYRTALYGNPDVTDWSAFPKPYDPDDSTANNPNVNPLFFNAADPDKLARGMNLMLQQTILASAALAAPTTSPMVGLNMGREAYLGAFYSDSSTNRWSGDVLAAGLLVGNGGVSFVDANGNVLSQFTHSNALWSFADHLKIDRSWKPGVGNGRKIWTTLDSTTTTLTRVNDGSSAFTNTMLNANDATERAQLLRFIEGAGSTGMVDGNTEGMRSDVVGDIIDPSPAALAFPISTASSSPALSGWLTTNSSYTNKRFTVILAATNQGMLHCMGEVSGIDASGHVQAKVEELWAYIPYQFLKMAKYLQNTSQPHIYGLDGHIRIYHRDDPASGQAGGDGLVNGTDLAVAVFGAGKGDRFYSAITFDGNDPFTPKLLWTLDPASHTNTVVQKMGLATAQPAFGRVETSSDGTQDVVFLGGGYSTAGIESPAQFGAVLGRSIIAVDVATGNVRKAWDLTAVPGFTGIGCISAGVVPFEAVTGSNRTHQIYFTDQPTAQGGGSRVFAIGTGALNSLGLRKVTSNIDLWTLNGASGGTLGLRAVYQAPNGVVTSSLPSPFNLSGPYPVPRTRTPLISVPAVGVLFISGDRRDPIDRDGVEPAGTGGSGFNQLTCVFDRLDSGILGSNSPVASNVDTNGFTNGNLADLTTVSSPSDTQLQPGNSNYYLANSYGYYLRFPTGTVTDKTVPDGSAYYYPKGTSSALAVDGVLFFNVFTAHKDGQLCGGSGTSKTYRMCDVMAPLFNSGLSAATGSVTGNTVACNGYVSTWVNVPSALTVVGAKAVIESGQGTTSSGGTSGGGGSIQVQGGSGHVNEGSFHAKYWRRVH